jgi:transcriptional regulator with XRE-family HTH domain
MTLSEFRKKYHLKQAEAALLLGFASKQQVSDKDRGKAPETVRDRLLILLWDYLTQDGADIWEVYKQINK